MPKKKTPIPRKRPETTKEVKIRLQSVCDEAMKKAKENLTPDELVAIELQIRKRVAKIGGFTENLPEEEVKYATKLLKKLKRPIENTREDDTKDLEGNVVKGKIIVNPRWDHDIQVPGYDNIPGIQEQKRMVPTTKPVIR